MKKQKALNHTLQKFIDQQQKIADKCGATVSIGTPGNMVTIARPKDKNSSLEND